MIRISFFISALLGLLLACKPSLPENSGSNNTFKKSSNEDSTKNEVLKNGLIKSFSEKTGVASEINYSDGKKDGLAKAFYPNGEIWKETHYRDNKLHGISKIYDRQGRPKRETHYEVGKKHGPYIEFFKSGNPRLFIEYYQNRPLLGFYEKNYTGEIKPQPEIQFSTQEKYRGADKLVSIDFTLNPVPEGRVIYYFVPEGQSWSEIVKYNETDFYMSRIPLNDGDQNSATISSWITRGNFTSIEGKVVAIFNYVDDLDVAVSKKVKLSFENF